MQMPKEWNCNPEYVKYLGKDEQDYQYWQIKEEIYKHKDGYTTWLSTSPAWPLYCQITKITK